MGIASLEVISLKGTHTYIEDLRFGLFHPDGEGYWFLENMCEDSVNFNLAVVR
jgi:hypothetical protein